MTITYIYTQLYTGIHLLTLSLTSSNLLLNNLLQDYK